MADRAILLCLCCLFAGSLVAGDPPPALARVGSGEVRRGDLVEWDVTGLDAPALDVDRLPVLAVRRGEETQVLPAFAYRPCRRQPNGQIVFAGPARPRIRHRFATAGEYHLQLLAADRQTLLAETRLAVRAGKRPPGPLRVSPHNPLLLAWADGTPYVAIGINLCWATGDDPLGTHRRYVDRFAAHGGNHFRLWAASWFGQVEGDDPGSYRLDQSWLLDQVMAFARERDMAVTLVIDNHHDIVLGKKFPYGITLKERLDNFFAVPLNEDYSRRLRYLVARYGAFDNLLAWELCNEIDLTGLAAPVAARWAAAAAAYLRQRDPYAHLRTISLADAGWADLSAIREIDLTQIHQYVPYLPKAAPEHQDSYVPLLDHQLRALRVGKPFCFAEIGHHGSNHDNPGNRIDQAGILLRQQAWGALLVGAYGTGMNWWWDVYVDPGGLWKVFPPLAATVAEIDWRDTELRPYRPPPQAELRLLGWQSPDQVLLKAVPWADTWYSTVVEGRPAGNAEFRQRGAVLTGLRPGRRYRLTGIDPATGEELRRREIGTDTVGRMLLDFNQRHPDEVILLSIEPERP